MRDRVVDCLFNLYAEYIMRNSGLEEAQAGIKIARRTINNLRYADDKTLMAENEEEGRDWGYPINQGNAKDCQQTTRNTRRGMKQRRPHCFQEEPNLRTR